MDEAKGPRKLIEEVHMNKIATTWLRATVLLSVLGLVALDAQEQASAVETRAGADAKVFVLPVQGPIDQSMLYIFRRAFAEIERMKPAAVIVELDTPGGRLVETREIIQWMRSLKPETRPSSVAKTVDAVTL